MQRHKRGKPARVLVDRRPLTGAVAAQEVVGQRREQCVAGLSLNGGVDSLMTAAA